MASTRIAILIAALALVPGSAGAQARLDARYIVTLAGVTIGKGAWLIDIGEDQYSAAASGATTGLLRVFASGEGTTAVRGAVVGGRFAPANYAASLTQDKELRRVAHRVRRRQRQEFLDHAPAATAVPAENSGH